jgi:hypothetical protein
LLSAGLNARQGQGLSAELLKGIALRSIGPALTTGRIADIEIDPKNPNVWYVASAFGGPWKTVNRGITFTPIFDEHAFTGRGAGGGPPAGQPGGFGRGNQQPPLVPSGRYRATLGTMTGDVVTPVGPGQAFSVVTVPQ